MAEYVRLMDGGDNGRYADTSNAGKPAVKTTNYTIKGSGDNFIFSNRGAVAPVVLTLPLPVAGERVILLKETKDVNFGAQTLAAIRGGVAPYSGTVINSTTSGEYASVELMGTGTTWMVVRQSGTWAIS